MMDNRASAKTKPIWPYMPVAFPLMLLMSASIVYPYVKALELRLDIFSVILMNAAILIVITPAFRKVKSTLLLTLAVLAVEAVVAVQYWTGHRSASPSEFSMSIDSFIFWAGNYLAGFRMTNVPYSRILAAIYSFIVCYAVAMFTVRRLDALVVSLCGAVCYVSLVVIGHVVHLPSLFACILASALYFLLQNYVSGTREVQGAKMRSITAYMISALPFAAAVLALTVALSTWLTVDPAWMKETRDRLIKKNTPVSDTFSQLSGTMTVSVTELGGPVFLNDEVMMEVESSVGNVYLRGMSKDEYTGHSWQKSHENSVGADLDMLSFDDTRELGDAFMMYGYATQDNERIKRMFRLEQMTVRYKGLKTGLVYLPQKTTGLELTGEAQSSTVVGKDELFIQYRDPGGMEYKPTFYLPVRNDEELINILKNCRKGLYGEYWQDYSSGRRDAGNEDENRYIMDALLDREEAASGIYKQYLQLPGALPQRVRDLAAEITAGLTDDYDKALAIEDYLARNYTYTLTPGPFNKAKDFVDEFLFGDKEGYCTYYATAMTVLLRCVGVPARYVEGYVMPGTQKNGVFEVTKKEGHAWVEAYFEGFGWYPFEPTTSFTMAENKPVAATQSPSARATPDPSPSPAALPTVDPTDKPASAPAKRTDLTLPLLILAAVAALTALLAVPLYAGARMRALAPRDAAKAVFAQYQKLLAMQKLDQKNGEPLAEYTERLRAAPGLDPDEYRRATEVFHLARFSPHEVTGEQKRLMLEYRKKLLRASRKEVGLVRYLWYRFMWGV